MTRKVITETEVREELERMVKEGLLVKQWNNKEQDFMYQDSRTAKPRGAKR